MKGENFIRVVDDAMTQEDCERVIEWFDIGCKSGGSYQRQDYENVPKEAKNDSVVEPTDLLVYELYKPIQEKIASMLSKHISKYVTDYETGIFGMPFSGQNYPMSQAGSKIQKVAPSQGYHVWHCENSSLMSKGRFLFYILYLNDIDEGGETEFIHLSERVSPKTGRLLIAPAGWTHTHRGNPPLSDTKYIITGWMEYTI